jgi:hypothetical protein
VVPLSLGFVQTGEDLQLRHFALTIVNLLTQVVEETPSLRWSQLQLVPASWHNCMWAPWIMRLARS